MAALLVATVLAGAGIWWFGSALPAQRAAEEQAAEQARVDAAAKKKADDSAAFWAQVAQDNKARAAKQAQADAAHDAASNVTAVKRQMEEKGWSNFSGDLYYQYADPSTYTCSYTNCAYVHVTSMAANGCPGGLYVEATVDQGDTSVGRANAVTAALPQGKAAVVKLNDTSGVGDAIDVTDIRCLRG